MLMPIMNWSWVFLKSFKDLAQCWFHTALSASGRILWDLIPAVIVGTLWRERNCQIFERNYEFKVDSDLGDEAKCMVLSWAAAKGSRIHINYAYSVSNWDSLFSVV